MYFNRQDADRVRAGVRSRYIGDTWTPKKSHEVTVHSTNMGDTFRARRECLAMEGDVAAEGGKAVHPRAPSRRSSSATGWIGPDGGGTRLLPPPVPLAAWRAPTIRGASTSRATSPQGTPAATPYGDGCLQSLSGGVSSAAAIRRDSCAPSLRSDHPRVRPTGGEIRWYERPPSSAPSFVTSFQLSSSSSPGFSDPRPSPQQLLQRGLEVSRVRLQRLTERPTAQSTSAATLARVIHSSLRDPE